MTTIEWTEKSWNSVTGCAKVSEGCRHCYAETLAKRFWGERKFTNVQCHDDRLEAPLRWRKPRKVFVNSMSDLFHEAVPDEFISRVFAVMALCPEHTFQILTKRPRRMLAYLTEMSANPDGYCFAWARESFDTQRYVAETWPLPNVWLGVSAEDQATADVRIPILLQTPAAVRSISYEPALGPVDLSKYLTGTLKRHVLAEHEHPWLPRLSWVICGAESGHGARPMELAWARSAMELCRAAGVPFFMKQIYNSRGRKIPFEQWPEDLKVREWPTAATQASERLDQG